MSGWFQPAQDCCKVYGVIANVFSRDICGLSLRVVNQLEEKLFVCCVKCVNNGFGRFIAYPPTVHLCTLCWSVSNVHAIHNFDHFGAIAVQS